MEEITLQQLLEAGCHFGHKSERWHPKANEFIFTEKDGIHIIDLAKTKAGLEAAVSFVRDIGARGGQILFVATKRQAKGVVKEEAEAAGASYFVERWIGGFLTNWDAIRKNIEKINRMDREQADGSWKKFPKHEQLKLARYLGRLKVFYGGVLALGSVPEALFIVDVKKEDAAVREGVRRAIPIVAIVDTNSDPRDIDYAIPANDDAVGSIQLIAHVVASAYREGKSLHDKQADAAQKASQEQKKDAEAKEGVKTEADKLQKTLSQDKKAGKPKKSPKPPEKIKRAKPAKTA